MPRNWEQSKEATPLASRVSSKVHTNVESRRLRYSGRVTSKTRTRRSSSRNRRSRSPRPKKSLSPLAKRHATTPEKRSPAKRPHESSRSDSRPSQKRSRMSPRSRNKTPPPRHMSRDQPRSYSVGKEISSEKPRNSQVSSLSKRDELTDRFNDGSKYVVDRPLFRGPEKDLLQDRDNLKKIIVNMRDISTGSDAVKRSMGGPDDIPRRPVTGRGSRDYREMDNGRMTRPVNYDLSPPIWNQRSYSYGRTVNHEEPSRYTSEGSRPLFDRDEVINHRRKFEENERERRRGVASSTVHSDRRELGNSNDNFRNRDPYYDDRNPRSRDYSSIRHSPREYDSRSYDKPRDDRSRDDGRFLVPSSRARSRSYDRNREPLVRKDRYDGHRDFRRSLERVPSDDRLIRRHHSPSDSRRHLDDYRMIGDRRERSLEKRDLEQFHYRDHEFPPGDRFSSSDYISKSQGYYENEFRESRMTSPSRGRGRALSFRGRGITSSRTFLRSPDAGVSQVPPVRPARANFLPREPSGRRMSFPPRSQHMDGSSWATPVHGDVSATAAATCAPASSGNSGKSSTAESSDSEDQEGSAFSSTPFVCEVCLYCYINISWLLQSCNSDFFVCSTCGKNNNDREKLSYFTKK